MESELPPVPPAAPPPFEVPPQIPEPSAPAPAEHPFEKGRRQVRRTLIIGSVAGILLVVLAAFFYIRSHRQGSILVADTSSDVTITLNGSTPHEEKSDQGYRITALPGRYRLGITKPNYIPYTQDVTVAEGQTVTVRPVYSLFPRSQSVTAAAIDYVRPSADGTSLFYLGDNRQRIYQFVISTQQSIPLTNAPLSNVTDIQWSLAPDVALIVQKDGAYLQEIPSFDFKNQTLRKIGGPEIVSPVWDPTNPNRIAFDYLPANGEKSLVFSDKYASEIERKADISALTTPKLVWSPDSTSLLLINRSATAAQNNAWIFFPATGTLKQLTQDGSVLDASYAPDGKTVLYQTGSGSSASLSIIRPDGSGRLSLSPKGTVATAAWKDASSFYLPDQANDSLVLFSLDGSSKTIPITFPGSLPLKGMAYFPDSKSLILYTETSIFTVSLTS